MDTKQQDSRGSKPKQAGADQQAWEQNTTDQNAQDDSQQMSQNQDGTVPSVNEDRFDNTDNARRDQTLMPSGQPDQPREGDPGETGRR